MCLHLPCIYQSRSVAQVSGFFPVQENPPSSPYHHKNNSASSGYISLLHSFDVSIRALISLSLSTPTTLLSEFIIHAHSSYNIRNTRDFKDESLHYYPAISSAWLPTTRLRWTHTTRLGRAKTRMREKTHSKRLGRTSTTRMRRKRRVASTNYPWN